MKIRGKGKGEECLCVCVRGGDGGEGRGHGAEVLLIVGYFLPVLSYARAVIRRWIVFRPTNLIISSQIPAIKKKKKKSNGRVGTRTSGLSS